MQDQSQLQQKSQLPQTEARADEGLKKEPGLWDLKMPPFDKWPHNLAEEVHGYSRFFNELGNTKEDSLSNFDKAYMENVNRRLVSLDLSVLPYLGNAMRDANNGAVTCMVYRRAADEIMAKFFDDKRPR